MPQSATARPSSKALGVLMSAESALWLVLRVIGLVFLICVIIQLHEFLLNVVAVIFSSSQYIESEKETMRLVNLLWDPLLHSIVLMLSATYFLCYGGFGHRLLIKEVGK